VSPGKAGLIFGAVAVFAAVAGIVTALAISDLSDSEGGPLAKLWSNYSSEFLGFAITYPSDWHLEERGQTVPTNEAFITGGVTISRQEDARSGPKVLAYKNFQGDWCLRGRQVAREVEVSGVSGIETNCFACEADAPEDSCPSDPHTIVRVFGVIGDPGDYVVKGETEGEAETVRRIVESFRFID
jgi:hypothetical protein